MTRLWLGSAAVWTLLTFSSPLQAADRFEFKDGDRVVLIGNALIEQEQRYGYWETAITARYPDRNITFRNLGWSGDTVFGDAQAGFGTAADGFKHLVDHVLALKPTVIILGYGGVEAFEGEKGLKRFVEGLNKLLDALAPTKARVILLAPTPMEDLGKPFPSVRIQNENLKLYAKTMQRVAEKRSLFFVDLLGLTNQEGTTKLPMKITHDGIHLTSYGYWLTAYFLRSKLFASPKSLEDFWKVEADSKGKVKGSKGTKVEQSASETRFTLLDDLLPGCLAPGNDMPDSAAPCLEARHVFINDGGFGDYSVKIDGQEVLSFVHGTTKSQPFIRKGPEFDQVEKLRQTIIEKDRLYFHRWRPQNETYLFGFRKHEQGQNAREIPQFDPLIAEKEKEIAKLRVPIPHTYEIVPAK